MAGNAKKDVAASSSSDVLILGSSFAGIEVYRNLRRDAEGRKLRVVVVDRQPDHGYIPLVHERVCGRLPAGSSTLPSQKWISRDPYASYVVGEVAGLDLERSTVLLADGRELKARFIVVALGSEVAPPMGLEGGEHLTCLKFEPSFEHTRARLNALLDKSKATKQSIVVIGGGISGVELAGELAYLARKRPTGWDAPKVILVQRSKRLLPKLGRWAASSALRGLRAQGVDVRLQTLLVSATKSSVEVRQAGRAGTDHIDCGMAFWTGGLRPAAALANLNLPRTDDGWLQVGPTLQSFTEAVPTKPGVFACGDAVRVVGGDGRWPTMQRAIECLWQGGVVAGNILELAGEPAGYPHGIPPLRPHKLRTDFFHGVSVGSRSLITYGPVALQLGPFAVWFRRFLMRQFFARYNRVHPG
ncbi:MAG: NAD(P)/FAD-dependent oxidoreductase [Nannocystaceae bacterium]